MKSYTHRSFVLDKELLNKLKMIAEKENRTVNWIVSKILSEYCEHF